MPRGAVCTARSRTPRGRGKSAQAVTSSPCKGKTAPVAPAAKAKAKSKPVVVKPPKAEPCEPPLVRDLRQAGIALKPDAMPGLLPCRDEEKKDIANHLRAAVREGGSSKVLFISGMPGTGKTASLLDATARMQADDALKNKFVFVHINAMCLGSPVSVYREILRRLPVSQASTAPSAPSAALQEMKQFFQDRKKSDPVVLLLIDEVDQLKTMNQAVIYQVFDWLEVPTARLVITAISNTMDLPERLLPRVASRFRTVRVDFHAYTKDQMQTILQERLRSQNAEGAFTAMALKFCAARVAGDCSHGGDLRKALQLCRLAAETQLGKGAEAKAVDVKDIEEAKKHLLAANPATSAISGLSVRTRLFLAAMVLELHRKQSDTVPLRRVAGRYEKLCAIVGELEARDEMGHNADGAFITRRLEQLALLGRPQIGGGQSAEKTPGNPLFGFGAGMVPQDVAVALLAVEEDTGIKELLEDVLRDGEALQ